MDKGEKRCRLSNELGSTGSGANDLRKPMPPPLRSTPILVQSTSTLDADASCEVTEVDIKAEIKCEPNYDCSENSDLTSDLGTCLGANNNRGAFSISRVSTLLKNKFQQRQTCYYIKSIILQCPACATSFKGGRTRLPCLLNHIAKKHCKMRSTLSRVIKDRYGVKEVCDCFACSSNRAHGLK